MGKIECIHQQNCFGDSCILAIEIYTFSPMHFFFISVTCCCYCSIATRSFPIDYRVTNIYSTKLFTTTFSNHAETELPELLNENKKVNTKMSYTSSEVIMFTLILSQSSHKIFPLTPTENSYLTLSGQESLKRLKVLYLTSSWLHRINSACDFLHLFWKGKVDKNAECPPKLCNR